MIDDRTWKPPRFRLGRLLITSHAQSKLAESDVENAILRHSQGDWGEVNTEDWEENDVAISVGRRLLSVYISVNGTRFCVITEADRSATTVVLPEDD